MSIYSRIIWMFARLVFVSVSCVNVTVLSAAEYSMKSSLSSNVNHNDNAFLTETDQTSTSSIIVSPDIEISINEANWNANLNLQARVRKYSDDEFDSNEQGYNASAAYQQERSIYVIDAAYDVDSNLSADSTNFGLVRTQVDRTTVSLSPRYIYNITELLNLSLSYTFTDVEYEETVNTGFIPYRTHVPTISLAYNISERSQVNFIFSYTDYERDDELSGYEMLVSQVVYDYKFTENISALFSLGRSRRDITTQSTGAPSFFLGTIVTPVINVDSETKGVVYGASVTQKIYNGEIAYMINRDVQTNSFGSLDEVNSFSISMNKKISDLWGSTLSASYADIENIGSTTISSSRTTANIRGSLRYSLKRNLSLSGTYIYSSREFNTQAAVTKPDSNSVYLGLNYVFDDISSY